MCLSVCLSACLPACLSACLPVNLSLFQSLVLSVCLSGSLSFVSLYVIGLHVGSCGLLLSVWLLLCLPFVSTQY